MKRQGLKRLLALLLGISMVLPSVPMQTRAAESQKITIEKVSAKSASSHGAELIKDGSRDTYWQSIPSNGEGDSYKMNYSHNRYIDITLDGIYEISQVKIFNKVDNSYNNYYVYASVDGVNYDKIISKTSNDPATAEGDTYSVSTQASHLRLNMAYNSNTYVTNLSEIELYGVRVGERNDDTSGIQVENWQGSSWQKEWDRFENDKEYAQAKILKEMENLVGRVIGEEWQDSFIFEIRENLQEEKDIFEVRDGEEGKIIIAGNNGLALASGFNYYLKNYVNVDYNPLFGSNTKMTGIVPVVETVVKEAQYNYRYALNFCTYSYTMAFWNWDEYEEFLDWAAMNGMNLILDIVGQEEVLRQTFLEYGFTEEEIKDYISGPAYYAWFYMQNLYSVGGPLPDSWFEQRTELGRKIHDRMQVYSISPVLQGFAGQVPETFPQKNTGAKLAPVDSWSWHTRPALLMTYVNEGEPDYFTRVAETFYEKQKNVFGEITDYYATDPFHEGGKTGGLDTPTIFQRVQQEMMKADSDAIWVMQQWQRNLDATKMSKMDKDHALALYLQADMASRGNYKNEEAVFENNGTPWIYNMLHNFGGRMGLDGEIPWISSNPMETDNQKQHMVGIGITPEALENSPVIYELFWETLWSKDPIDYNKWVDGYARRRAGGDSESLQEAWDILVETAYATKKSYIQGAAETVMNARPTSNFSSASTWGHSKIEYEKEKVDQALLLLAENYEQFKESEAFRYDLAEVAEQVICNVAVEYHSKMVAAVNSKNIDEFTYYSNKFLTLFDLAEQVLSSTDEFMLGTWIEASRKMIVGADDWTKDLFEYNARTLITTWGGESAGADGRLKDYSNRKWAGLTSDFYKERWSIWIRNRKAEILGTAKNPEDQKAEGNWFLWEYQWTNRKSDDENGKYGFSYTADTGINLGALANKIYNEHSYTAFLKEGAESQTIDNTIKGIVPTLEGITSSGSLEVITDGTTGEGWVASGTDYQTLTFELGKTYELKSFMISTIQLAKEFPYSYKLESYNQEEDSWEIVKESYDISLSSNEEIFTGKTYVSSKLKLTIKTADATDSPLTITEFAAYGKSVEEPGAVEYKNLALHLDPTINVNTAADSSESKLTDGDTSATSLWKTPWVAPTGYVEGYPATIELDLEKEKYVDHIQLHFESAGRPFQFTVSVNNLAGEEREIYNEYEEHTGTLPQASFTIPVQDTISKVTMNFVGSTGQGEYGASTPAMTEIIIMGLEPEEQEIKEPINFSGGKINGVTVAGGGATNNLVDSNRNNFDRVTVDEEIVFTLPETHYVKAVEVTFEKGAADANDPLSIRYQLYGIDQSGKKILLYDKGNTNELLPERTIQIPVEEAVSKLIFVHKGNSGQGQAYRAEARIYEFEVYGGEPDNVAEKATVSNDEGIVTGLTDDNPETVQSVSQGSMLTVTLNRAVDIRFVSVEKKGDSEEIISCQVEYFSLETNEWLPLCEVQGNSSEQLKAYGQAEKIPYTDKLRFSFNKDTEISEIGVYAIDYSISVLQKIGETREYLNSLSYGEGRNQYKEEAKNEIEIFLREVEEKAEEGIDSVDVPVLIEQIEEALEEFKKTSVNYLNRDQLLYSLSQTKAVLTILKNQEGKESESAALEEIFNNALTVYNTYEVTQSEISSKAQGLLQAISVYESILMNKNPRYAVTFMDGEDIYSMKVAFEEGTVQLPEEPKKEGNSFKGWYTDVNGAEIHFTETIPVSQHMQVYAKWVIAGGSVEEEEDETESRYENIWIKGLKDQVYTGANITQKIKVYDGDQLLIENADYTVSYKNNRNAYEFSKDDLAEFEKLYRENPKEKKYGSFEADKAPQIILKMKGNYTGTRSFFFQIERKNIENEESFIIHNITVANTGKKQSPIPVITWKEAGKTLKNRSDFEVLEYADKGGFTNPSQQPEGYQLTIEGKGNFKGTRTIQLVITKGGKEIAMNKVTVKGVKAQPYTGEEVSQNNLTVTYKKVTLVEGTDFEVSYQNNVAAGTATLLLTGTGTEKEGYTFVGTKSINFKINGYSINKVKVTGLESYPYTGKEIQPLSLTDSDGKRKVTLTLPATKTLPEKILEQEDYTVAYEKNMVKGTATMVLTGNPLQGVTGSKKLTFKITATPFLQGEDSDYEYAFINAVSGKGTEAQPYRVYHTKGGAVPTVKVTRDENILLVEGRDYTVVYKNNKKPGEALAIIKGKGNYSGSIEIPYLIDKKPVSSEESNGVWIVVNDKVESTKKNGWKQSFKVWDSDGKALNSADYENKNVEYSLLSLPADYTGKLEEGSVLSKESSNPPAGSVIQIRIFMKGNYEGELTGTYKIIEAGTDISKAKIQIKPKQYTGMPVEITSNEDFETKTLKVGKETIVLYLTDAEGENEKQNIEVVEGSYINNVKKGTAKVTFRGINGYHGIKTVSFKIGQQSILDWLDELLTYWK